MCDSRHGRKTAASGHGGVIRGSEGVQFGALARVIRQVGSVRSRGSVARGCPVGWVASSRAAWCGSSVAAIVVQLVGEEAVLDGLDNMPLEPTPGGPLPRPARVPALDEIVARAARLSGNVSPQRPKMNDLA